MLSGRREGFLDAASDRGSSSASAAMPGSVGFGAAPLADGGLRRGLDWVAFVPSRDAAGESARRPATAPADFDPTPVPIRGLEERRAEVRAQRWRDAESSARRLAEGGALHGLPSARDYATWSDERIAALRADPEAPLDVPEARHDDLETHPGDHASLRMPGAFLDEGDAWSDAEAAVREVDEPDWEDEAVETLDVHPLNLAVERVEEAQREVRLAEATRVQAALSAWRIAMATVTGTPDAMINGVFHKSVMLQLATSLQVAEQTASALVHAADDLEHRLPKSWTRFVAGDVPWRGMQRAHAAIEGLDARF